jgi:hypothetical protein
VLDHVCGDHEKCEETWCYDKKAQRCNITYTPPEDHRINKEHDPRSYEQLKKYLTNMLTLSKWPAVTTHLIRKQMRP